MTTQEAFNTMVKHLRAQGVPSIDYRIGCLYRGPNGLKCAVGCLISDEEYRPDMETFKASVLIRNGVVSGLSEVDLDLLDRMQRLHDCNHPDDWEDGFQRIATDYRLEMPA